MRFLRICCWLALLLTAWRAAAFAQAGDAPAAGTFGYASTDQPGAVAEHIEELQSGVTEIRFANNVELTWSRDDRGGTGLHVLVRFGSGWNGTPTTLRGLPFVADQVFIAGGLGKHRVEDWPHLFGDKKVSAHFEVQPDSFTLEGETTAPDLRAELELLKAYVTDPGYRQDALVQARAAFPDILRERSANTFDLDNFRIGGLPTLEQAEDVTMDDLRVWLAPALQKSFLEISLAGDFDPSDAQAAVAATFGTLPDRAAKSGD